MNAYRADGTLRRFFVRINLKPPTSWRDQAVNPEDWDVWDRQQRADRGWFAGLAFWKKTNVPGMRTLLSRHWPHRLCWSWHAAVTLKDGSETGRRRFALIADRQHRELVLVLFGPSLRIAVQDSDWMVGTHLRGKVGAPVIRWKHELKNAPVAGSA